MFLLNSHMQSIRNFTDHFQSYTLPPPPQQKKKMTRIGNSSVWQRQLEKALTSFYCLKKSQKREKGELQIRSLNLKGYMKVINELIPLQFYISIQISSENSMLNQDNTVL